MNDKTDFPVISTTILNWNRADLLDITIGSYLKTIQVPFELFIIDNASTDNSRDIIEKYCEKYKRMNAIFLSENKGGAAINIGLEQSRAELLHVSENDIKYLLGWSMNVLELFKIFENLGQLSLFGPVPTDNEIWEIKPSSLCHSKGSIVYKTSANIGTSSVFPKKIVEKGIRFQSIKKTGSFIFPNDSKFSADIQDLGLMVAWAPHYLVKNIGHLAKEFNNRQNYYRENYKSKHWLGESGWENRINLWNKMPKPTRESFVIPDENISPEKSMPTSECPLPQLWSMFDGWTAEVETIEFLYAITRLIKPIFLIETGTWHGYAAEAIGKAMQNNGFGELISIEIDKESFQVARKRIKQNGLEKIVTLLNQSSLDYIPKNRIDFMLLDSALEIRFDEFNHFQKYLKKDAYIAFHDTSEQHKVVRDGIKKLSARGLIQGLTFPTPRGLALFQYTGEQTTDKELEFNKNQNINGITNNSINNEKFISKSAIMTTKFEDIEPICITGMHRSGTSMVTRILNLCGIELGNEKRLMEEHHTNPKGFWENLDFVEINQSILKKLNGSWDSIPSLYPEWYKSDKLEQQRTKAYKLIENFTDHLIWGWKDPRNSITIEFWKYILPKMKIVICLRNPVEVALSLKKRNHFSIEYGLELWTIYNKILFSNTKSKNRVVTHFANYFNDPIKEITRINSKLNISVNKNDLDNAISTISKKLRHNNYTEINDKILKDYPQILKHYKKLCLEAAYTPEYRSTNQYSNQIQMDKKNATNQDQNYLNKNIKVSIIIPVYNNLKYTKQCIYSIFENTNYPHYQIIIIDNGSTDGTKKHLKMIEKKYDNIQININKQNLGFAKASNQGAKIAKGSLLLFLNNDTKVTKNWLTPMLELIENDSSVGAVGSKLLYPDNTIQHAGVYLVNHKKNGDPLLATNAYVGKPSNYPKANIQKKYQALSAACLLIRKNYFNEVNGFDERFWNGYEDIDLCFKLREKGYKNIYQPNSVVVHHESKSSKERFSKVQENVNLLHKKWIDKIEPDFTITKSGKIISKEYPDKKNIEEKLKSNKIVSIIILSYNTLSYTQRCINSIKNNTLVPYELILVDNGSTDGSKKYLRNLAGKNSNYHFIDNNKNKGFSAGNNQGMEEASGDYILLLNSDILVSNGWLRRMVRCANSHPKIGLVGPLTNRISGTQMVDNPGYEDIEDFPEYAAKIADKYAYKYTPRKRIAGFAMLIKRELYDKIGGLDEDFGTGNYEDDDYCIRARKAGYRIYVSEDTFIHHFGSRSFHANRIQYQENLEKNEKIFREKWPDININQFYEKDSITFLQNVKLNREGIKHLNNNNFKNAKSKFLKVLEDDPINTNALYGLSICEKSKNNIVSSVKIMKRLLKINPSHHQSYNFLGKITFENKNYEKAFNLFQKALKLQPDYINAKRNLGIVLSKMERNEDAIRILESIVDQNPNDTKSLHYLIKINSKIDNLDAAKRYSKMMKQF